MPGNVCKTRNLLINDKNKIKHQISDNIDDLKKNLYKTGKKSIDNLQKTKKNTEKTFQQRKNKLAKIYLDRSWRRKRPDMTLFVEILLLVALAGILFYLAPHISGIAKQTFSNSQLKTALNSPLGTYNVADMAQVQMEANSFKNYTRYFTENPFSDLNMGTDILLRGTLVMPMIMFFFTSVVPPFVLWYIIWFCIKFAKPLYKAGWGWYIAMYKYFTALFQGVMGCKWYIRMVTGWSCRSPNFMQYYTDWRRRYIDVPVYYEKLNYIRKYLWVKKYYFDIPYYKTITAPYKRYTIKTQYAKKLYVDRAVEVFLKNIRDKYPQYYTMPKSEFIQWLSGNNKELASVYAKAIQAKEQIEGRPYRSMTKQGKQCTCPGSKTPVRVLTKKVKTVAKDIDSLVKATNDVYDNVTSSVQPDCKTVDTIVDTSVKNRHVLATSIIVLIILVIIILNMYSALYGAPAWLANIISSTMVLQGARLSYIKYLPLSFISIAILISTMIAILYT
jgi:hypothetical protein